MTDGLVQWYGKQLDWDERVAKTAGRRSPEWKLGSLDDQELGDAHWLNPVELQHAALHDPARVLREIDAKRQILVVHDAVWVDTGDADGNDRSGYFCTECDTAPFPCRTLRLLALPYADRPGYLESWRP